ncbi:radical SAM protein [bacterium]|nr:radical SAM protein [bacterium]NIN92396.1 radical SAM protein [bacterium]NIO18510.1 radical SAM protein [bacterium]NIO73506.1 radical SAM protein [bacterium]
MSYVELYERSILKKRKEELNRLLEKCHLCPRKCLVDRLQEEKGFCGAGKRVAVSSYNLHFGEEPPISGYRGSGTIFFTHCNLRCCFCQNYPISQLGNGQEVEISELARMMVKLQKLGAHNINFVTPTHFVPQIVEALQFAVIEGLNIPLVYNSGGYDSVETLKLLDGVVDIYMPDSKYSNSISARTYSRADDYFEVNKKALLEMHRQVGDLKMDREGIAKQGLLIRHLVMPEDVVGSRKVLEFIGKNISQNTYMSIMAQYHPAHLAFEFPELSRRISRTEYDAVLKMADELGLERGWRQNFW